VPDTENPADFLTKWVDRVKFEKSIEYATNASQAVEEMDKELQRAAKVEFLIRLAALAKRADHSAIEGKTYYVGMLDDLDE
jgi:hypothetical protein